MEVKHRCNQILELGFPLGGIAKLFAQDWEGDVTIVMPATLAQLSKVLQNPSYLELQKSSNQGRRCTWEKLSAIKANCGIELALDECVSILNHIRRVKRSAERAATSSHGLVRFHPSKRIPSWNCIARENSTGSLDEDVHQGVVGSMGGHPAWTSRSDNESESVDINSWTRSGGPLMRTTSADKFVDFVQSLDVDGKLSKGMVSHHPNDFVIHLVGKDPNSSSIMISEGDLLQPERIHNGIVFNVVKKEDFTQTNVNL